MPFKPGHTKTGGRKKGTPNKKRVPLASEYLASRGINPINEIIKLLPELDADQKLSAWKTLLSHTQPRVSEIVSSTPPSPAVPEEVAPTSQLLSLVKDSAPKQAKGGN